MLTQTRAIALRTIKYGETSVVATFFTEQQGVISFMVKGVRTKGIKGQKASLLQPSTLLDVIMYTKPTAHLHQLREYTSGYTYETLQQEVVKNTIALFSSEVLFRLFPENAIHMGVFSIAWNYFVALDKISSSDSANFPLYLLCKCAQELGFGLGVTEQGASSNMQLSDQQREILTTLGTVRNIFETKDVKLSGEQRYILLLWLIEYLGYHSGHMGTIRSLEVLRAILR